MTKNIGNSAGGANSVVTQNVIADTNNSSILNLDAANAYTFAVTVAAANVLLVYE